MFKNKITLVNKNLLGNKDRKKLVTNVKNTFCIEREEDLDDILCKENTSVCKVQNAKITVYLSKNTPVLFCVNNVIYPTVYTLWKYPKLIPCFVIYPPASEYLLRGADLMIPGICKDIDNLEKLKIGDVWGVRVFNNPYIFAVGSCLVEYNNNNGLNDLKGKCLKLIHIFSDELWKLGSQTIPDKSFKNKIIDSVEDIVDDFNNFKIFDENRGKKENKNTKKKENKNIMKEEKKNNYFGWGSDSDVCQEKETAFDKSDNKNNIENKKEEDTKCKSVSNEKYLENFYKHLKILTEKNNKTKNSSYCSNNNNINKEKEINNSIEKIRKTNKINQIPKENEKKEECTVDFDEIEKNLNLNEKDKINYEEYTKKDLNKYKYFEKGNKSRKKEVMYEKDSYNDISDKDKNEHIKKDEEYYYDQEELKDKKYSLEKEKNINEKKDFDEDRITDLAEEEIKSKIEISNKNVFELNTEQQDLLFLYVLLEVLYSINDDQLPLEVSGIYSRMTKECTYIHRNEKFLEELHKCNVSYENIKMIKKNEVNLVLDIKKSSYKKLLKFIQHCTKIKLIKIKEKRNIVSIVNVCKENPLLSSYKPTPTSVKKKNENEDETEAEKKELINKGTQVLEFYMPTNKTLSIFRYVDIKTEKTSYFNIIQLKDIFKAYVKIENLQDKKDTHLININETLESCLSIQDNVDKLPYEDILNKFISAQQPCYSIIKPYANFDIEPIKIIKGVCPSIHIYSVARMRGKKFVTHITNLYLFHLDLNKFCEYLQKQLACSCSIVISPSTKKEEILVQGNVVNQMYKILVNTYYLPKKYIVLNSK